MRILVTGATGFIASQIVDDLIEAGHDVTCCVRNVSYAKNLFPKAKITSCDFIKDTASYIWFERLQDIDVVINCVGILYHPNKKIIWAVHFETPKALFSACVKRGVKKIIQLSALGIERYQVDYAQSKKAADDFLLNLKIPAIILRPSLVYGCGSYGGSSLFRGLASIPLIIPVPRPGTQKFQPIHLHDLSQSIVHLVKTSTQQSIVLSAVGPEVINLREILKTMRAWLGFSNAKIFPVPLLLIRLGCFVGDLIPYSSMNSTSYKMLAENNFASNQETKKFHQAIGFIPRDFTTGIYKHPSTVQDRWHAKLFFLKPLLSLSIAFVWIFTAIVSAFLFPKEISFALLNKVGINHFWQPYCLYGASLLNAFIGITVLINFQIKKIGVLQILLIIIYSVLITWKLPFIWLEPFAPIAKNVPLIVAILIMMALESDR